MINFDKIDIESAKLLKLTKQEKPSIDVTEIANRLGINIIRKSLGNDLSGVLVLKGDNHSVIGIDIAQGPQRERFTIAHELGHYILHRKLKSTFIDEKITFTRGNAKGIHEVEANAFAASLLMPKFLLEKNILSFESKEIGEEQIEELAKEYKVSNIAMTYRLTNLRLI
ncbi:protein of unknown function [Marivirga sericea]|uniref:IrrE N-terminal-like domain-containing protein n=1 Tax=Marivirga sericea TaxID=1028 RepID=A0A1X7KMR5_9BACT|nr:ImmA/IrrE family metallo-endopeptidase [Marivirga sericea]SMG42639.1 protein of unknown function [Marivirga sericea]